MTMSGLKRSIAVLFAGTLLCAAQAGAQEKVTVRDSWTPTGVQAAWHWGLEKGIFKKHGIDLAHEDGNGSTVTVQLVGAEKIDVGYTDLSAMTIGRERGMRIVSIAGLMRQTTMGIFVPKGSGIKTIKDLEGKELIYTATSFEGPFMDAFLRAGGTSREKVNLVSVDASAKISTYAGGRGSGMITSLPFGAPQVERARPSDTILLADYGFVLPSYGLVVHENTLKNRPEALRRVVAAFLEAQQQIIDGGDRTAEEAADIMIKRRTDAKIDRVQNVGIIKQHIPYYYTPNTKGKPLGWQSTEDWQATLKAMEEAKLIKPGNKPASYFTNDFIPAK
jgi:NitT/TauT family transport system substrate-binding protein